METEAWYLNPEIWVAVSFAVFVALAVKFILPLLGKNLDERAAKIREQLEQASRLRAEAEALLTSYQQQQTEKLKEAEAIVTQAKADAAALRARAAAELTQALERRSQQAHEKIARAESEAVAQIRTKIIDIATQAAREIIATQLEGAKEDPAVTRALAAIERQIH